MKRKLVLIASALIVICTCIFIYSCNKSLDSRSQSDIVPAELLSAAKEWEAQQTQPIVSLSIAVGKKRHILKPKWKEARLQRFANGEAQIVVPSPIVHLDPKSKQGYVRKFVYTVNGSGQIMAGKIVEMYGPADYVTANKDKLIENYTQGNVSGFTGVAINYDVTYKYLASDVYKGGVRQNARSYIIKDHGEHTKSKSALAAPITTLDICFDETQAVDYWINGVWLGTDYYYLYTICYDDLDGGGNELGGNPDDGGSPDGGGGGGGQTSQPSTGTTTSTYPAQADPCAQKSLVAAIVANATVAANDASAASSTATTGLEYGYNKRLSSWPSSSYISTPVTAGTASTWTPQFTWNATQGYTMGYGHAHPSGNAPSPDDVMTIIEPVRLSAELTSASPAAQLYYEANTSVITLVGGQPYVVTIRNWNAALDKLDEFNTVGQSAFDASWSSVAAGYLTIHPTASAAEAGSYALMTKLGSAINLYQPQTSGGVTTFTPLTISSVGGYPTVTNWPCP